MYSKYLLPAAALAATVAAKSSSSDECSGTATINAQADASVLQACKTWTGDVVLSTSVGGIIQLDGVEEITGSLTADGASQLSGLEAGSLTTIGKSFKLIGATILSSLTFPSLVSVHDIDWEHLNGLQSLAFSTDGVQMASTVNIQDTQLVNLDGINLQTCDSFTVANNKYLTKLNMQLGNFTKLFSVQANSPNFTVSLPNLIWGNEFDISNVTEITMPSLTATNGSLNLVANFFESFAAPNLTMVGGTLRISANPNEKNASFPELTKIGGGFIIANNTKFEKVDGFPKVKQIKGAFDFFGNFTDVETPKLNDVEGTFNLQSYNNISSSCATYNGLGNAIRGKVTCKGLLDAPGAQGTDPSATHGSGSGPTGAASSMIIPGVATCLLGVMATMFGLL